MRKLIPLFGILLLLVNAAPAQFVTIPDINFRNYLQQLYPACFNGTGQMDTTCTAIISEQRMEIAGPPGMGSCNYTDVTGIQYFKNLRYFNCSNNNCLSLSNITLPATLETLFCAYITAGPQTFPPTLVFLDCRSAGYLEMPSFPGTLKNVMCGENYVTALPPLPPTLEYFDCSRCSLNAIPALPSTLISLECGTNSIQNLPPMPNSLKNLSCYFNGLQTLPDLSSTQLFQLVAHNNQLNALPALPSTLRQMFVSGNQLTNLPALPVNLEQLVFNGNFITSLAALPPTLYLLDCSYNSLTELPELPASLATIKTEFNYIDCLPRIPVNCSYFSFDYQIRCLPNRPVNTSFFRYDNNGYETNEPIFLCSPVTNTNGCQAYPVISGTVFIDINSNGVKDPGEFNRKNARVSLSNGHFTITDNNGRFEINTDSIGETVLTAATLPFFVINPSSASFDFTSYDTLVQQNFSLQPSATVDSLSISLVPFNWAARPGFSFPILVSYENIGTTPLSADITVTYDNTKLVYDSVSNTAVTVNGNTFTLQENMLIPGESKSFIAYLRVNPSATLGDTLYSHATITSNNTSASTGQKQLSVGLMTPMINRQHPNYPHYRLSMENLSIILYAFKTRAQILLSMSLSPIH